MNDASFTADLTINIDGLEALHKITHNSIPFSFVKSFQHKPILEFDQQIPKDKKNFNIIIRHMDLEDMLVFSAIPFPNRYYELARDGKMNLNLIRN